MLFYDILLKIHTKKSLKTRQIQVKNGGNLWRHELLQPILGDSNKINKIINNFISNKATFCNILLTSFIHRLKYHTEETFSYCSYGRHRFCQSLLYSL